MGDLIHAVDPSCNLTKTLEDLPALRKELAAPPRKRRPQAERICEYSSDFC